jgi:hypothetical protein
MKPFTRIIKPGVTEKGFFHGIKDYKDESIIEELCANSYDADASCVLVFFDGSDDENKIYIIDDGKGFSDGAIESVAKLGGGDDKGLTNECFASSSGRPYLGLFGYGLKSVFKISRQLDLYSANKTSTHEISIEKNKIGKFLDAGLDVSQALVEVVEREVTRRGLRDFNPQDIANFIAPYGKFAAAGLRVSQALVDVVAKEAE